MSKITIKFTKLYVVAVVSLIISNSITCMNNFHQNNSVVINPVRNLVHEINLEFYDLIAKFEKQDLNEIKHSFNKIYNVCCNFNFCIEPFLLEIYQLILKKRLDILNENISVEEKNKKLLNLYFIYDFFSRYGLKIDKCSRYNIKNYFSSGSTDNDKKKFVDNLVEKYLSFGFVKKVPMGCGISTRTDGFLITYLALTCFRSIEFCKDVLWGVFDRVSYLHPKYLKKLNPDIAKKINLQIMPDEDKNLIELFAFLCYQLDIFERPQNMQSLLDKNFDILKFAIYLK